MTYDKVPIPGGGFIKLMRSAATRELLRDSKAFGLLTQIALRAKRTDDFNIHDLKPGQALIGDHDNCGLSAREYRSAKDRLRRYGLARFHGTSRGTIATLANTMVYDINEAGSRQNNDEQPTSSRQTADERATTIKNEKNEKKEKKAPLSCSFGSGSRRVVATFEEMDRERARRALALAREEFVTDDKA